MPGKTYIGGQGGVNINDFVNITAVQLFMPFTDDLNDKSIYGKSVVNKNGVLSDSGLELSANGYISTNDATLVNYFNRASRLPFTFEAIIKINDSISFKSIITSNGSGGAVYSYIQNKRLVFRNTGSGTNNIDVPFDFINIVKHLAYVFDGVNTKLFIDGVLVAQTTVLPLVNASIIYLFGSPDQAYQINTVGGVKVTAKALEPSQFSMVRPMQLKYPNFKVGNREYAYKEGIWNPNFDKTTAGTVTFNDTNILVGENSQLYISGKSEYEGKKLYCRIKQNRTLSPVADASTTIRSQNTITDVCRLVTVAYDSFDLFEKIVGISLLKPVHRVGITCYLQTAYVYEIWIE